MATQQEKAYAFAKGVYDASLDYLKTVPDDLTEDEKALVEEVGGPKTRHTPEWEELDPRVQMQLVMSFDADLGNMVHRACALGAAADAFIKQAAEAPA